MIIVKKRFDSLSDEDLMVQLSLGEKRAFDEIYHRYSGVLFGYFNKIQAQLSTRHFIPPLTNAEFGNANPENQYFYISTPNVQNVNYTIKQIGLPAANDINGTVNNTNPQEIFIGTGATQLFQESPQTSTVTSNKGQDLAGYIIRLLAVENS